MGNKRGIYMNDFKRIYELPLLEETDVSNEIYNKTVKIANLVKEKYRNKVTGVWFLPFTTEDDEICLLIQSNLEKGSFEYLNMQNEICNAFEDTPIMIYDYDTNIIEAKYGDFIRNKIDKAKVIYVV